MSLHIRVKTPSDAVMELKVEESTSVGELKQMVLNRDSERSQASVKLICAGKLLQPDAAIISAFGVVDGSFVHAVFGRQPSHVSPESMEAGELVVPPGEMRGLDRLCAGNSGLSADEVAALRRAFADSIATHAEAHPRHEGESHADYLFRIEEEWMLLQGADSEFALNLESSRATSTVSPRRRPEGEDIGTFRDFMVGYAMGFLLGAFMLVGIWDNNVSYRQKKGILMGVLLNLLLAMYSRRDKDNVSSGGLRSAS